MRYAGTVRPYHHQAGFAAVAMKMIDPEKANVAFNPLNSDHGEIDPVCVEGLIVSFLWDKLKNIVLDTKIGSKALERQLRNDDEIEVVQVPDERQ